MTIKLTLAFFCYSALLCVAVTRKASGQTDSLVREQIAVTARASADSISLRWAPITFDTWRLGNRNGYRIERYTVARDGQLLSPPEIRVLHPAVLCLRGSEWEPLVKKNRYAAIAAQALYGNAFQVDLGQSNVLSIVNKVQENEQRFAFALFAADMSPAVARASGLWFTDHAVKTGEKYLYRIAVHALDSLRGSVFAAPGAAGALPPPQNFQGDFKEQLVSLRWESQGHFFSAYRVERSTDGRHFTPLFDAPLVTVSPSPSDNGRYQYAIDSLRDLSKTYHYRVVGITPFGEESPPSAMVSGKGAQHVSQVPYITAVDNIGNAAMQIRWDFPHRDNGAISGFRIERAAGPKEEFLMLTQTAVAPGVRTWLDKMPGQVNYYRMKALGRDGQVYVSPVYYAQLVDSIPPATPAGLRATVDDSGRVQLTWNPNRDRDLLGYRIYKGYHKSEEPAQITTAPIPDTLFTDKVDLHTLNTQVYYRVMAIDVNQNHSALSLRLVVPLPDKVKPLPPVFLPAKSSSTDVALTWVPSPSEDVVTYSVFRKLRGAPDWSLLATLPASDDSLFHYRDHTATGHAPYYYLVVATDDAGLESDPADPVTGSKTGSLLPPVVWRKPTMNREENRLTLRWTYDAAMIRVFRLYVAVDNDAPVLYKTIAGGERSLSAVLIPGRKYTYRIMAHFKDGGQSRLSEPLVMQY